METNKKQEDRIPVVEKERSDRKKEIRLEALRRRDSLTAEQRKASSGRIVKKLAGLSCYQEAEAVLTYISFRSEVDTFPLLEHAFADGKAVFAPKVLGREMDFFRIFSPADLTEGYRKILEPAGGQKFGEWNDDQISQSVLICLPGAAFDRARHRIGYGGGFYDRYLSRFLRDGENTEAAARPQAGAEFTTAALAFDCQIFKEIPWEAHDIRPELIVTEKEIF